MAVRYCSQGAAFPERLVQYAGGLLKQDAGVESLALLYACLRTLRITELQNTKSALKLANDVMDTMRKLASKRYTCLDVHLMRPPYLWLL
jgi:hypothetical protein